MGNFCQGQKRKPRTIPVRSNVEYLRYLNNLTQLQINAVRQLYQSLNPKQGIQIQSFKLLKPSFSSLPQNIYNSLFCIFDFERTGKVSLNNLCCIIAKYILGSRKEKCEFIFNLFDFQHNGTLVGNSLNGLVDFCQQYLLEDGSINQIKAYKGSNKHLTIEQFSSWAVGNLKMGEILRPFEIIPSPLSEFHMVEQYINSDNQLLPGTSRNLISAEWFNIWENFVYSEKNCVIQSPSGAIKVPRQRSIIPGQRPVEINNRDLMDKRQPVMLRKNLREGYDYVTVPKQAWDILWKWYGGGPQIQRPVIQKRIPVLQLYPPILSISVVKNHKQISTKTYWFSRLQKIEKVIKEIIPDQPENFQLYISVNNIYRVSNRKKTLEQENLLFQHNCVISDQELSSGQINQMTKMNEYSLGDPVQYNQNGIWIPLTVKKVNDDSLQLSAGWAHKQIEVPLSQSESLRRPPRVLLSPRKGLKGLFNLGNTCYLNSVIQCINHFPLMSNFFSQQAYQQKLNKRNPRGSHGKICSKFGVLLQDLKENTFQICKPDKFLLEFSNVFTQFKGFYQQDAHQFLRQLLDILHEDLSRTIDSSLQIHSSISLENPSAQLERETSSKLWEEMQGSIGSVITDFCGGQTKRTMYCTDCLDTKVIFQAFMDLSVPVPIEESDSVIKFIFVPKNSSQLFSYKITVQPEIRVEEVHKKIEQLLSLKIKQMIFATVENGLIKRIVPHKRLLVHEIADSQEFYVYEVHSTIEEAEMDGKLTLKRPAPRDWIRQLQVGLQVDYYDPDVRWIPAIIHAIEGVEVTLQVQKEHGPIIRVSLNDRVIAPFRQFTRNTNSIIMLTASHTKPYKEKIQFFGCPLLISIGSWYTQRDLKSFIIQNCLNFSYKTIKQDLLEQYLQITIMDKSFNQCALCRDSSCVGCQLGTTFQNIEKFYSRMGDLLILIQWKSPGFYFQPSLFQKEELVELDISQCLQEFVKQESIDLACQKCNCKTFKTRTEIWRAPDILIIHLKRFQIQEGQLKKINNLVRFPLKDFQVAEYMMSTQKNFGMTLSTSMENFKYHLFAVVNHSGSPYQGHYTCFCYQQKRDVWLEYDDDKVYEVPGDYESQILTSKAYILFYRRLRFATSNHINLSNIIQLLSHMETFWFEVLGGCVVFK